MSEWMGSLKTQQGYTKKPLLKHTLTVFRAYIFRIYYQFDKLVILYWRVIYTKKYS